MPIRNCQAIQTALQIASLMLSLRLREQDHGLSLLVGRSADGHGCSLRVFQSTNKCPAVQVKGIKRTDHIQTII